MVLLEVDHQTDDRFGCFDEKWLLINVAEFHIS